MAASWTVLDSDAERQAAALRRSAGTVGPWPLYASSVLDEQYDKVAGRAALTLTRVDGRMAAWRRSGATGPGLMTSYSFRRADDATAAPLGGTQPTGAFIPGSGQASTDSSLRDAPEHPGEPSMTRGGPRSRALLRAVDR